VPEAKLLVMRNISIQDEQHQGDSTWVWTEVRNGRNTAKSQACSPHSDRVSLHATPKWSDCGRKAIPTLTVLRDHGQQIAGPDTEQGVVWRETASIRTWTTVRRDLPGQKLKGHFDSNPAKPLAQRTCSHQERRLLRIAANVDLNAWALQQ
jgi:hypothetical protein